MDHQILYMLLFVILSAFFSGTELAFVVANKIKIEVRARKKNLAALNAKYFVNHPQNFFSTILIGNNIVNVAYASLGTVILSALLGWSEIKILIVLSAIILFFGEIIPKYLARELADRTVLLTSIPLRAVYFLLYPFVKITSAISNRIVQTSNLKSDNIYHLFDKEDIKGLVKESEIAGMVDKRDSDLINKVIELGDQRVYEAMTPRTEIVGVEITSDINEVLSVFIDSGFSKLPVYENDLDNIKGVVLAKDLFKSPQSIKDIIREVSFIPETKKSFDVLNDFLEKRNSIAIVVDEHGGTAGIVTIEDILEELFGEIEDEFDVPEDICRRIAKDTYIVSGKVEVDYINEKYNLNIQEGDYETLSGFITTQLGRIPHQGEIVTIGNFNIQIVRATSQRIELVKLTLLSPSN
ncbi:MAG: HlyC/CorC family transporter [Ignavibacteriaceae bacterium]|nr:HlyC/CorC family transporter [Ignavibacteriaceae bacterium]